MHVVNTVRTLRPDVSEEDIPLQPPLVLRKEPSEFVLPSTHSATSVYFGIVMHVCGGEGITRKVGDPITKLIVTRRYEASLFAVKGVEYVK